MLYKSSWKCKAKGPAKKEQWRKYFFSNCKMLFSHFSLVWPLLLSTQITFLLILNNLKCWKSTTWNSKNHLWTLIATDQHKRKFWNVWDPTFVVFSVLFFLSSWPLFTVRGIIFTFLLHFQRLLMCWMCQEEGFKFCLDTRNNGALPLDLACPENLNVWSPVDLLYFSLCSNLRSVIISWRILVSFRGFFWRLYPCMVKYLSFHNSSFALRCKWQGHICDTPLVTIWMVFL